MEPEPTDVEGQMAEADVAEMMGFASFGRKRKHADSSLAARPAPGPQPANAHGPQHPTGGAPAGPPSLPAKRPPPGGGEHDRAPASDANSRPERIWWIGYYDPTSNENPWEILERKEGLEPLGTWLPRGHARREQGRGAEGAQEAALGDAAGQGLSEGWE